MFYDFIWCSKTYRVSKNQMIKDYNDGGCRMVHVPSFIESLKLSWIKDYLIQRQHGHTYFLHHSKLTCLNYNSLAIPMQNYFQVNLEINFGMTFHSLYMTFKI